MLSKAAVSWAAAARLDAARALQRNASAPLTVAARANLPFACEHASSVGVHARASSSKTGEVFADSNVPSNPAYHFKKVAPGSPVVAGWGQRKAIVDSAAISTKCVHAGCEPDPAYGSVMPPIYMTSTFAFTDICTNAGYDYTRSGNPTRSALEEAIAKLEGGSGATCTSTGMSAVLVALNLLTAGQHVIATIDLYGGSFRTLEHLKKTSGIEVTYLDLSDVAAVRAAVKPGKTAMIWVETPSNPLLRVTSIPPIVALAKEIGAYTVVDNTFLSPVLQQPIKYGVDLVVHSTTKYLNGHSDVVGGAVVASTPALAQRVAALNNLLGTSQSPHDCFLVLRGIRTLKIRMEAHQANAKVVAAYLSKHAAVRKVNYPNIGAMMSFELHKQDMTSVNAVLRGLRWFTLAESLGGVESLVAHPASMTHASMTPDARARAGISDGLIRLSIGIEDTSDLVSDLARVLDPLV